MMDGIQKGETLILPDRIKDPIQENVELFFNHFGRYFYAARALAISEQDIVIDASCGCGYGSCGLARKAKHVYGLDVNNAYLDVAKQSFCLPNLTFFSYSDFTELIQYITRHGEPVNIANKVICIETFEHVPANLNDDFLQLLVRCLKPSGSMFLTAPLGNDGPSSYNSFHCFEPRLETLHRKLSRYFQTIQMEIDRFRNSFGQVADFCYVVLKNKKEESQWHCTD
jgi:2-polyprenyl-3-methyl-5-hydroxy-6-metoxy-1,4-benzoquinol methylase